MKSLFYSARKLLLIFAAVLAFFARVQQPFCQDFQAGFWPAEHIAILHDFGYIWSENTIFKPYRWERIWSQFSNDGAVPNSGLQWIAHDLVKETQGNQLFIAGTKDTLNFIWWNGVQMNQSVGPGKPFSSFAVAPFSKLTFWFRQRLNVQLFLRATNEPASLPGFTGHARDIRRFGLNAAEFDHAAVSYHNGWLLVQFARGRQIWGSTESETMILTTTSPAYDHFMLEGRYKRLKLRFFNGFLESITDEVNINRYLVGHGIEYSNHRNLLIVLSELIVYSGENRPFDISFLNPLAFALEVEQNNRTNKDVGSGSSNSLWSAHVDWMPLRGLRLSGDLTIDEFQFDRADRQQGRPDATAYSVRASYSKILGRIPVTVFSQYTRIGSLTFRHDLGANNFVSRNLPLGSDIGSDADRWQFGTQLVFPIRFIISVKYGFSREGDRSLLLDKYASIERFTSFPFPSGQVQKTRFLDWRIAYRPFRNFEVLASGRFSRGTGRFDENKQYLMFSLNAYLPWSFGL